MWFFRSPQIVFGETALSHLEELQGRRVFLVTDRQLVQLGYARQVTDILAQCGLATAVFDEVEPNPSLQTVKRCAADIEAFQPDWIIALGGGSVLDAAKVAWFIYERPDVELEAINPIQDFGLRSKARFLTIPTTAGSGAEVSMAALITDTESRRKLELASYEFIPDITIVDPLFTAHMPASLTCDSGIDVLTHAVEGINNTWSNDFIDGFCYQAAWLVFNYLPRAVAGGANDPEARERMANAATLGGLVIANSNIMLAHAMGHSAGPIFNIPHGRVTGLMLPLCVEYMAAGGRGRYTQMARFLGLGELDEAHAGPALAAAIRGLLRKLGQPISLQQAGVSRELFEAELDLLVEHAGMDYGMLVSPRPPDEADLRRLFDAAYYGNMVDF
jgi:alcohol dehydrogenase class IV